MALSDELAKLKDLHDRGVLDDAEFARAKARTIDAQGLAADSPTLAAVNALRRSSGDRWLAGVCGGVARATGIDSWIWRLVVVLLTLWGGAGVLMYALMWIFVPDESVPPAAGATSH
jgi:phage shock protein PspC (stress-responsive transcriptional regulator)